MKMKLSIICLVILLLLAGFGASCGSSSLPEAPELDLADELNNLEQIIPDLSDIDVGIVEIPLDIFGDIDFDTDLSLSSESLDLTLPYSE
ncbi:hypothetical protein ACFLW0_04490 [Chloroflexota bacterium]